jgi:hypothetical protein
MKRCRYNRVRLYIRSFRGSEGVYGMTTCSLVGGCQCVCGGMCCIDLYPQGTGFYRQNGGCQPSGVATPKTTQYENSMWLVYSVHSSQ